MKQVSQGPRRGMKEAFEFLIGCLIAIFCLLMVMAFVPIVAVKAITSLIIVVLYLIWLSRVG